MAALGEEMENVDEIQERLRAFNQSLSDVEHVFKVVHQVPASLINTEVNLLGTTFKIIPHPPHPNILNT